MSNFGFSVMTLIIFGISRPFNNLIALVVKFLDSVCIGGAIRRSDIYKSTRGKKLICFTKIPPCHHYLHAGLLKEKKNRRITLISCKYLNIYSYIVFFCYLLPTNCWTICSNFTISLSNVLSLTSSKFL